MIKQTDVGCRKKNNSESFKIIFNTAFSTKMTDISLMHSLYESFMAFMWLFRVAHLIQDICEINKFIFSNCPTANKLTTTMGKIPIRMWINSRFLPGSNEKTPLMSEYLISLYEVTCV